MLDSLVRVSRRVVRIRFAISDWRNAVEEKKPRPDDPRTPISRTPKASSPRDSPPSRRPPRAVPLSSGAARLRPTRAL
jgi:hypothetical protein